jgi:hypothetical protein
MKALYIFSQFFDLFGLDMLSTKRKSFGLCSKINIKASNKVGYNLAIACIYTRWIVTEGYLLVFILETNPLCNSNIDTFLLLQDLFFLHSYKSTTFKHTIYYPLDCH